MLKNIISGLFPNKNKVNTDQKVKQARIDNAMRDVPAMRMSYETIIDAIKRVESNELMGSGKLTKREHLAEMLYAMFKISEKSAKKLTVPPLMSGIDSSTKTVNLVKLTYDRVLEAIVFIENNELMGNGYFNKKQHLADHLFALFNLAEAEEVNAVTMPASLGPKSSAAITTGQRAPTGQVAASQVSNAQIRNNGRDNRDDSEPYQLNNPILSGAFS